MASRSFGDRLREYRLAAGLTQEALAERAALSVHGIQKLERGVTRPFRDTVDRLVGALNLDADQSSALHAGAPPVHRHGTGWPAKGSTSTGQPRHNLPAAFTGLIGRERELEALQQRLRQSRMLTLVGTGGCGKTRLAIELARAVLGEYPDGVWLVELAPIADPGLVVQLIGAAVGVHETAGHDLVDSIAHALQSRRLLLVVDNCEHVLDACAPVAGTILQSCAGVRILATSREPMHIAGEMNWPWPRSDFLLKGRSRMFRQPPAARCPVVRGARTGRASRFRIDGRQRPSRRADLPKARRHSAGAGIGCCTASLPARGWLVRGRRAEGASLLGRTYYLSGAYDQAHAELRRALELFRANRTGGYALADCNDWAAALHCALGLLLEGARLFGAAEAVWLASGARRWPPMVANYERDMADLERRLAPDKLQHAWREAARWTADEAIDYALMSRPT